MMKVKHENDIDGWSFQKQLVFYFLLFLSTSMLPLTLSRFAVSVRDTRNITISLTLSCECQRFRCMYGTHTVRPYSSVPFHRRAHLLCSSSTSTGTPQKGNTSTTALS